MKKNSKKEINRKIETRDQYTVVLEDIRSNIKGIAEGGVMVNEKVDRLDKKVDRMDTRLERVEGDLTVLKGEVSLIRHNQITMDEFNLLESRVLFLEKRTSVK